MDALVSIVQPRLDGKPWGGRKLERFGLDLPPGERIGEALVTAGEATVTAGYMAGSSLGEIVSGDPARYLGALAQTATSGRAIFPLLVKLIDATENLSIQVHPNDTEAQSLDRLGKTEAWHVLAADPGAVLYLGVQPGVEFGTFMKAAERLDGSSAHMMRAIPAQPGTTVIIPAGTIHALGAGVMVYEVQQPSDVTFRLDDWGRVDAQGNPREVHLKAGCQVSRPEIVPELIEPIALRVAIGERQLLTACRYFMLERVALPVGGSIDLKATNSPVVITVLKGAGTIDGMDVGSGNSAVVWPSDAIAAFTATRPAIALMTRVPDLQFDVAAPARAVGADTRAISALSGATGDLAGAAS